MFMVAQKLNDCFRLTAVLINFQFYFGKRHKVREHYLNVILMISTKSQTYFKAA